MANPPQAGALGLLAALFLAVAVARADDVPMVPPVVQSSADVPYPPDARGDASVELELTVDKDGAVTQAIVLEGDPPFRRLCFGARRRSIGRFPGSHGGLRRRRRAPGCGAVRRLRGAAPGRPARRGRRLPPGHRAPAVRRSGGRQRGAAEYLRRYPSGFRRAEIETLPR